VGCHHGLADGQTKTAVAFRAGARFVGTVKALEDVREVFGGNADAGIGNGEDGATGFGAGADANFAPRLVVVDGVGEEVDPWSGGGPSGRPRGGGGRLPPSSKSGEPGPPSPWGCPGPKSGGGPPRTARLRAEMRRSNSSSIWAI
jgi:hypothetical protein